MNEIETLLDSKRRANQRRRSAILILTSVCALLGSRLVLNRQWASAQTADGPSATPPSLAHPVASGISFIEHLAMRPDARSRIAESNYDVLEVTVSAVSAHAATNGNPPVLSLQNHKVFRGDPKADRRQAIWSPPPHDMDRLEAWRSEPLTAPATGLRMIVLGELRGPAKQNAYHLLDLVQLPSSEANHRLVAEAVQWGKQLHRERLEHWDTFPENVNYTDRELLEGAQPVTEKTSLHVRQPVLVCNEWFAVARSRVIEVLQDDRVKVRPSQYNSRWDRVVSRNNILLYPADLKPYEEEMKAWRATVSADDLRKSTAAADFIGIGKVSSGSSHTEGDGYYTFVINEIHKGAKLRTYTDGKYYLSIKVPRTISRLISTRDRSFILFLTEKDLKWVGSGYQYDRVHFGDGMVEADDAAIKVVRDAL